MEDNLLQLPYLTRKMLAFEGGAVFNLRIKSKSLSNAVISIRGITREGPFKFSHSLVTGSAEQTQTFAIPDIPIMVCIVDESNFVTQGRDFVILDLLINGDKYLEFFSGSVYQAKSLSWPATTSNDKILGGGFLTTVQSTNPAANNEATLTVTTNEVWRIVSAYIQFTADANVANRRVRLVLSDATAVVANCYSDHDHSASNFKNYYFGDYGGVISSLAGNDVHATMPSNIFLSGGDTIATSTLNRQVGDDFGALSVRVEKYFT